MQESRFCSCYCIVRILLRCLVHCIVRHSSISLNSWTNQPLATSFSVAGFIMSNVLRLDDSTNCTRQSELPASRPTNLSVDE